MTQRRRVVITGLGPITPIGIGKQAFWDAAKAGKCGTRRVHDFDELNLKSKVMGTVDWDPREHGLTLAEVRRLDRLGQFVMVGADLAMDDSRLDPNEIDRERAGVNIANAVAGTKFMDDEFIVLTEHGAYPVDPTDASPYSYAKSMPSTAGLEVAARYGFENICTTSATGCTGGIDAIGFAFEHIRDGYADVMLTGGAEAPITPITIAAFDVIGAMSKRNHDPEHASRPFDKDRDAFVLAEGAGIMVMEELEHARARDAHVYGEVLGYGSTSNAFHMTGLGGPAKHHLARALQIALDDARVNPQEIDHVNAHGSGTVQNDQCETEAIKIVFGARAYQIPVTSLKSMTGHALAAARAIETVQAMLTLDTGFLTPTINLQEPSPECDLDYVPNVGRPANIKTILKDASGFSGLHSAMILRKVDE